MQPQTELKTSKHEQQQPQSMNKTNRYRAYL